MKITIDVDDKLYEKVMKKRYDQSYKRARIFFEPMVDYYAKKDHFKKYNNLDYRELASMKLDFT